MPLLDWLRADAGRILIVLGQQECVRLQIANPDVGKRIMTWQAYWSRRPEFTADNMIIDEVAVMDADLVLERLCFHKVGPITISRPFAAI